MLLLSNHRLKLFTYPAGERGCVVTNETPQDLEIPLRLVLLFEGSDDIIDMLNVVNALRHMYGKNLKVVLSTDYLPFSRQDRVTEPGGAFSLQMFSEILKMCQFSVIETTDVHSSVAFALFPPGLLKEDAQENIWRYALDDIKEMADKMKLISPDAGAAKKIYGLAKHLGVEVIEAQKIRDPKTGAITKTSIDVSQLEGVDEACIVDDICDGGRTFTELGKVIREGGYKGKLRLCITHGIFSKGVTKDFEVFDSIHVYNSLSSAEVDDDIYKFNERTLPI